MRYRKNLRIVSEEKTAEISARMENVVRLYEEADQNITGDEIGEALKKLEAGKTACFDGMTTEYLKM